VKCSDTGSNPISHKAHLSSFNIPCFLFFFEDPSSRALPPYPPQMKYGPTFFFFLSDMFDALASFSPTLPLTHNPACAPFLMSIPPSSSISAPSSFQQTFLGHSRFPDLPPWKFFLRSRQSFRFEFPSIIFPPLFPLENWVVMDATSPPFFAFFSGKSCPLFFLSL